VEHGNSGGDENDATGAEVDMGAATTLNYFIAISLQQVNRICPS
jgi:hypothetical protein